MTEQSPEFARYASALLPGFALQREVGRGGMGVVYLATDVKLDRPVAVKVLPEHLAASPAIRDRFLREARTAAKLSHPNIVPIYRADESNGVAFFVMGYVDGPSLGERLAEKGALSALDAAPLLRDVALALAYAHAHGVVHRDVKPENILIDRESGRALVTDFGIARLAESSALTGTGQVMGTVYYMSPEQASGEALDGRSDVYSLGVVAFRALTGRLPFDNEAAVAVLVAHVTKPAPRVRDVAPGVPQAIADIVDRCLLKDPAARFEGAAALAAALDAAARALASDPAAAIAVVSEREAQAVWARAAQLQAETGMQTAARSPVAPPPAGAVDGRSLTSGGYRMSEVRAAAEEAGIPDRYVARAAAELGLVPPASTPPGGARSRALAIADLAPKRNPWVGAPTRILFEVEVPREVRDTDFEEIIATIRQEMSDSGHVSNFARSLHWSSTERRRRLQLSIVAKNGRTVIRADERLDALTGGIFGGIMGAGGGGTGGIWMGIGAGMLRSPTLGLALWGTAILTAFALARRIFASKRATREAELRMLVGKLAELIGAPVPAVTDGRSGGRLLGG